MTTASVLIVGCGELGSRFLQAVAQLPFVDMIEVVDPSPEAREVAAQRLAEVAGEEGARHVRWASDIEEVNSGGDVAIIATHADGRPEILRRVLAQGYSRILSEKVVAQSVREYDSMLEMAAAASASVWVNCKMRAHPVWKHVKERIEPGEQVSYVSTGGSHGLCTNGIHAADLFSFLSGSDALTDAGSRFDSELIRTKRGKFDLSGRLCALGAGRSTFSVTYARESGAMPVDIVVTPRYRWLVDHLGSAYEGSGETGWAFVPLTFGEDLRVSTMAMRFVTDILESNRCELPTLGQCASAHRFVLSSTLPGFNELLQKSDDICPIT